MHKDGQLNGKTGLDVGVEDNPYYPLRRREERTEPEALTQKTGAASVDDKDDGPAVEVKPKSGRQRRLAFACALLVLLAAGGGLLYFLYGRTTTIEHQIKAKPGLSAQIGQGRIEQPNNESPDQQTLDAIKQSQDARRAGGAPAQGETAPSVEPAPQVIPSMPKLQIPGDSLDDCDAMIALEGELIEELGGGVGDVGDIVGGHAELVRRGAAGDANFTTAHADHVGLGDRRKNNQYRRR